MTLRLTEQQLKDLGLTEKVRQAKLTPASTRIQSGGMRGQSGRRGESPPQRVLGAWLHATFPGVFIENYRPKCTDKTGKVRQYEIDFADPVTKLGLEVDGYRDHGSRKGWQRDREKDMLHTEHGWHIIRVTPKQVYDDVQRILAWVAVHRGEKNAESH